MTLTDPTTTTTTTTVVAPVVPRTGALRPLGIDEITISGGFWGTRTEINRRATLPHILHWLEKEGWLPNFDLAAAGTLPKGRRGREFADSEVYKLLEAMAWELGARPDSTLEQRYASVVARVAAAQDADGYLNTHFGRPGQGARWSDLEWGHELYCLGHLFQAAVARSRTRPAERGGLLDVARRAADLVCTVFGPDGIEGVCGHPEVETGLAELGRETGDDRYVRQAELFVARRGQGLLADIEWGRSYFQDDVSVLDSASLHGHAVRANYLAAGAVDVAVERGDQVLLDSLIAQWRTTMSRRTYITGGQGAHHQDEAFGHDWELPADRAYSETCAGIGSIMFSWRLLLATGDEQYADTIERTLFNVIATSPDEHGTAFYYSNTLHQREAGEPANPTIASPRASASLRAPWFEVSCCPPNVARTLASLPTYLATVDDEGVQLHQYAPATISTSLLDGSPIRFAVETDYPADGLVKITIDAAPRRAWSLRLRVPAWGAGSKIRVLRRRDPLEEHDASPGQFEVHRIFDTGDVIELELPMEARVIVPDPRIDAIRGTVAIERGPEVLCLESTDIDGLSVDSVRLDSTEVEQSGGGARVRLVVRPTAEKDESWPYGQRSVPPSTPTIEATLRPYNRWANRGPSTMRVWLPLV